MKPSTIRRLVLCWSRGVVERVRLAMGRRWCRSQTFLLKQRNWTEVVVNIAPVFDITPWSPHYAALYAEVAVDIQPHFCFRGRPRGLFCGSPGWLSDASVSTTICSPRSKPDPPRLSLTPRCARSRASNSSISSFAMSQQVFRY
jgi:hypothetical protein